MPVLAASSSPSDRTYSVAIGVILVFGALEILAIAIHFGADYRAEHATLQSLKEPAASTSATPTAGVPMDTAGKPLDAEGLPEGSVFGVTSIETEQIPDSEAETNLRLKIGIKKRQGVAIDHSKLRIMVLFYDSVDNDKVVATDADVNYEWMNPKHDWVESNPETLIVTYLRSKTHAISSEAALSAAAAAVTPGKNSPRSKKRTEPAASTDSLSGDSGRRRYLGYVIRILYDDKLQTVRAEPARLINDAPNPSVSP